MFKSCRNLQWLVPALALLLTATPASADETKKKEKDSAPAPSVLVSEAKKQELADQTEFVGRVEALEKVDLRARVTGFLREQKFDAGADVKEGDVLYVIEREPFEAALAQRKAQLASAEATQENAKLTLGRYKELESKDFAPTAKLDEAIAAEKRSAASIIEANAAIEMAEIELSYTTIISPITGQIGRTAVDPGNLVSPESGVLATVVRTDKMYVTFPVTQRQLLDARKSGSTPKNLVIRAKLADGSLLDQKGTIDFLDVKVDPRTDGQLVRAVFPNPDRALTDGQTLRLVIERSDPDKVITIPMAAVATDQAGPYVFVVKTDDTVEQRRLKLGSSREGLIAVTEGVKVGDRVIVQGQQKVRVGGKVKVELSDDFDGSKGTGQ